MAIEIFANIDTESITITPISKCKFKVSSAEEAVKVQKFCFENYIYWESGFDSNKVIDIPNIVGFCVSLMKNKNKLSYVTSEQIYDKVTYPEISIEEFFKKAKIKL